MSLKSLQQIALIASVFLSAHAVGAQGALTARQLEFQLLGDPLPDGTKVGVVQRRKGAETTFECMKIKGGRLTIMTPPEDGHAKTGTCFLIIGLTELDQFDEFMDHPERWSWTRVPFTVGGGQRGGVRFHPKGETPRFRGKVLGPDGRPLEAIDVRFWRQEPRHQQKEIEDWMPWGYDPCTGRFWALCTALGRKGECEYLLDLLPYGRVFSNRTGQLAPVIRMAWAKDQEIVVKFLPAGHVRGSLLGLEGERRIRYVASLHWEADEARHQPAIQSRCRASKSVQFSGLPAGKYRLEIRVQHARKPLFVKRGLVVESGKVLEMQPIDLSDKLSKLQVSVQGEREGAVDAMVYHVRTQVQGSSLLASAGGSNTGRGGQCTLVVPRTGVDLCIWAAGWGPQVFTQVHEDLKVTLQRPQRIRLRLVGLRKHPDLLKHLYVRAQPVAGYPRWAWQVFATWAKSMEGRAHGRDPGWTGIYPALAPLEGQQDLEMDLPFPGRWKFELAYSKWSLSLPLPLPALDSVQIQRGSEEVTIEVPISKLRHAHTEFQALFYPR